ncbi:gas vesicle protein GvpL/GvpF [Sinobaca qinghaiensis]|uniref:Gas vesicle protein GvpL/GvpF n=1 Tax=Sinobaca qinghaiensis TaxID=342944 RepID=A0A419V8F3_9BACL|nr:GvpL/GvpF family gas vesicle protein [Sinobaca qinghaiensis]RKD76238.1 gas vesicle protein GvpL/GvpF [Sinobaca qinghaiensis]
MSGKKGVYLFCVIEADTPQEFGTITLLKKERDVYTVNRDGYAMVVADAPVDVYEPNRKNLKSHQDVVTKVMERYDIIPMSFGNVLEGKKDVHILMEKLKEQFDEIFPKIRNKFEVGLKIIGKKEWLSEKVSQQPGMKELKSKAQSKPEDAAYYERMQLGESAHKFMIRLHEEFENEVFHPLADISDAAKSNEVINERMLLNAAFLLDKDQEEAFEKKLNEIYNKWMDSADFKYTGPWPAYNFIDIKLTAKGAT